MEKIVTHDQLNEYKAAATRSVRLPDGTFKDVRMTPEHWEILDALLLVEEFDETDIVKFAQEESSLQDISFDQAYRCCVSHLAKRWTP